MRDAPGHAAVPANAAARANAAVAGAAEPFFFESANGAQLLGVWRPSPQSDGTQQYNMVWVVCPPFAEEEKSAHRTLVEICEVLRQHGQPSLFFAYYGTGDSAGEFGEATLSQWRQDILAACAEARQRAPQQRLGLLGLRLGASLAIEVAAEAGAERLILMEPVTSGRQYIGAMSKRKSLRAMMTQQEAAQSGAIVAQSGAVAPPMEQGTLTAAQSASETAENDIEDFDGWGVSQEMRAELESLDLLARPAQLPGSALLIQIGPREQIGAPLQKLADALGASVTAVTMQPFWNLLDYVRSDALAAVVVNYQSSNPGSG